MMGWTVDMVCKSRKVRKLLQDICADTLPTVKACLQWPGHHRIVLSAKVAASFRIVPPWLVKVYA